MIPLTRESRTTIDSSLTRLQSHMSKLHIKLIICLLVVVFILISTYHAFRPVATHSTSGSSYFTVVVDCGSTGSRVNVYEWFKSGTTDEDHPVLLQSLPDHLDKRDSSMGDTCQYHCMQTEPGLDKFVHNISGMREALEPLLLWAEKQIPSDRHGDTSLFLLATAGLRKLPIEEANWILETAEEIVKFHPFIYRTNWIRVLSGQEEAYYGWAALNYKMGSLESSFNKPTFGVLDLGGSSLQVVMETDKFIDNTNVVRSKIGSVEHDILTYSLPAFGLNEAFDRAIVMLSQEQPLIKNNTSRLQLRHPCLGSGVSRNYTCHGCFPLSATNSANSTAKLLSNESSSVILVGDPDWEKCKGIARAASIHASSTDLLQLLTDMNCTPHLSPTNSATLQNLTDSPKRVSHFHALSGFYAVYNVLNLNPKANLTNFMERGQELCSDLWANLKEFPGDGKYAEQFCFNVPYLASLVKNLLCVGDTELIFGPGDVSWTLGAALVEGKATLLSSSEPHHVSFSPTVMEVISSPILLVTLFLCLSFVVYLAHVMWTAKAPTSAKKAVAVSLPSFISPKRQSN